MASVSGREVQGCVIRIDEEQIRDHVEKVVRNSVEETLNGLLDAEADRLCRAKRYGRSPDRAETHRGQIPTPFAVALSTPDGRGAFTPPAWSSPHGAM